MPSEQENKERSEEPHPSDSAPGKAGGLLALYQTSTRASAGELAAGVVHDLNNPLQVMMLHLELLQAGKAMPNWIEMFGVQFQRITALTDRLRVFSNDAVRVASVERADVHRCIDDALGWMDEEFRRGGITVHRSFCPDRVEILGNAGKIHQALLELLINAREAMSGGGTLHVETTRVDSRVVLRIADSGPGIPAEIADELFKPFVTTKGKERAGIGLAICARTFAHLLGEINLEEGGGGRGAKFRITLPLATD